MKRNGNGYKRRLSNLRRLKKLYDETKHSYGRGAWYDASKGRIIEYSFSDCSKKSSYAKKASNRKARHSNNTVCYNRGKYRRLYDYWHEMI